MFPGEKRDDLSSLIPAALAGDRRALARLISLVENGHPEGQEALDELFPRTGKAHRIGITGAPGTGKSSLVSRLALFYRRSGPDKKSKKVAIVAVDPTSPFTGGAVLGDRVRMRDLAGDSEVFIRSMASRGALGGLANSTAGIVQILDAVGFEVILIETVGAGQSEVEIAHLAHTTLVVEAPGMGDEIQAIKAGLLEIADILVVNKADLPRADLAARSLKSMVAMAVNRKNGSRNETHLEFQGQSAPDRSDWVPPVIETIATRGNGVDELGKAIDAHEQFLHQSGGWVKREEVYLQAEIESRLRDLLFEQWKKTFSEIGFQDTMKAVMDHQLSPRQAVEKLLMGRNL
jgi:LAO/AO transport system kinase